MSNYYNTSHNEASSELQGSILRGILGSVTGMIVCILVMLLCSLFQMRSFSTMLQLFVGLVIGFTVCFMGGVLKLPPMLPWESALYRPVSSG